MLVGRFAVSEDSFTAAIAEAALESPNFDPKILLFKPALAVEGPLNLDVNEKRPVNDGSKSCIRQQSGLLISFHYFELSASLCGVEDLPLNLLLR